MKFSGAGGGRASIPRMAEWGLASRHITFQATFTTYRLFMARTHRIHPRDVKPIPRSVRGATPTGGARDVIRSPIRTQRTGFQKIAQVLSDTLLRDLARPPLSSDRKLVVFSDSRQDAAKLSAGMRFFHYRDALRQALVTSIDQQGSGPQEFAAQCQGQQLTPRNQAVAAAFANGASW